MTGTLLLVLEGLLLFLFGCDVAHGFALLSQPSRCILMACAAAGGIVARHFLLAGVDDGRDAGHGDGCFGDVGRDDHAPAA